MVFTCVFYAACISEPSHFQGSREESYILFCTSLSQSFSTFTYIIMLIITAFIKSQHPLWVIGIYIYNMLCKFNSLFNHNKEFRWTIKLNFQNLNKAFESQKSSRWKYLQSWFSWLCLDFSLWLRFQFLLICQIGSYFMLRIYLTWFYL